MEAERRSSGNFGLCEQFYAHPADRILGTDSPNFITEIFYLTATFNHYGLMRTIQEHDHLAKDVDQLNRDLQILAADTTFNGVSEEFDLFCHDLMSWQTPLQERHERAIREHKVTKIECMPFHFLKLLVGGSLKADYSDICISSAASGP
jgi:hypothetical protein